MNNHKKHQHMVNTVVAAFEFKNYNVELRQFGLATQIKYKRRWYDIHGNLNGYWLLSEPGRNKMLAHQMEPTRYAVYAVPQDTMKEIATRANQPHIDTGRAIIEDQTTIKIRWPSQGTEPDWKRTVLDMRQQWLKDALEKYRIF